MSPAPTPDHRNILKNIVKSRIVVVGDVMLDRFVYGAVSRISPEAPVPVLRINHETDMPGGAGNTAANLAALGAQCRVIAMIGTDDPGKRLERILAEQGIDTAGLIADPAHSTTIKTRYLAGHQQMMRADHEDSSAPNAATRAALIKATEKALGNANALVMSDYGKGVIDRALTEHLIRRAREKNIPVIVDPKGADFTLYRGADVITPNKGELALATRGHAVSTDTDIENAANIILGECGIGAVITTRSRDGISVIRPGVPAIHIPGRAVEVYDVSGAGDTVVAVLAAALAGGAPLDDAAHMANIAGGIAVAKVGTAPVRREELDTALNEAHFAYADQHAPCLDDTAAAEQVRRWRARGLRVGFTNGCFDILHAGHVSYLNAARGQCDRLIVGLNRDSSVKLLKGPDRPVHDENARAAVLGALASIDMVILFGAHSAGQDNTASSLLRLLQPDLYFKGGDYRVDDIPEKPAVESYGGRIALMPNFEGHSTTSSIEKAEKKAAAQT